MQRAPVAQTEISLCHHLPEPNGRDAPLGDEDGPATDPAVAEIVDHFVGGVQGVAGRVEHDFALLGEGDQVG